MSCSYCINHLREDIPCPNCDKHFPLVTAHQQQITENRPGLDIDAIYSHNSAYAAEYDVPELIAEVLRLAVALELARESSKAHQECGNIWGRDVIAMATERNAALARAENAEELLASATRLEFCVPGHKPWYAMQCCAAPDWITSPNDDGFNCSKHMTRDEAIAQARRLAAGEP